MALKLVKILIIIFLKRIRIEMMENFSLYSM